jgi:hypothetical protein
MSCAEQEVREHGDGWQTWGDGPGASCVYSAKGPGGEVGGGSSRERALRRASAPVEICDPEGDATLCRGALPTAPRWKSRRVEGGVLFRVGGLWRARCGGVMVLDHASSAAADWALHEATAEARAAGGAS